MLHLRVQGGSPFHSRVQTRTKAPLLRPGWQRNEGSYGPNSPSPPPSSSLAGGSRHMQDMHGHTLTRTAQLENPTTNETQTASEQPNFLWVRQWYPVTPISYLHTDRPNAATILGKELVIWHHSENGWVVMEDKCPHRLAPLSEGRVIGDNLACSYHGWQWGPKGNCTNIPQMTDSSKACASGRSCVTTYPHQVVDGVLFVFLDTSPEGLAESQKNGPRLPEKVIKTPGSWNMFQTANDAIHMLEQSLDPTHGNFLHTGLTPSLGMEKNVVMRSEPIAEVSLQEGFTWNHRGYSVNNKDMHAVRTFIPPYTTIAEYSNPTGPGLLATICVVPVNPGESRTVAKFSFLPPAPPQEGKTSTEGGAPKKPKPPPTPLIRKIMVWLFKQKGNHWMLADWELQDQDGVMLHRQEHRMRRQGLTDTSYALFAKEADEGIVALNRWMRMAGYKSLWEREIYKNAPVPQPRELSDAEIMDVHRKHLRFCKICQEGKVITERFVWVAAAAAAFFLITSLAAALVAIFALPAASASWKPWAVSAGALVLAGLSALAASRVWEFRERKFVSGYNLWQRKGGLSMVPRS